MPRINRSLFSRRQVTRLLVVIVASVILVGLGYAGTKVYRYSKVKNNFSQIQKGQTKQEVLNLIGPPDEITACRSEDRGCAETLWYYGFMERWIVYFDRSDRVIDVNYNVSH